MAVAKVGKSGGAGGAIDYLLKEEKEVEKKPNIIGGNVATFGTKDEIKDDFANYSKLKPNVKNEVVHISISLTPGEHLDEEKKVEFSEKLLEKLDFKIDKIPYLIVEHHDKNYEHWHIVAGRITSDAKTVKEWKIAERTINATKELEQDFGLNKVEYKKSVDRQTKRNEYKMMERTEEFSVLAQAKIIIDKTLEEKPTTQVFVENLQKAGFEVQPNISEKTGKMSGFAFKKDEIIFKSSAIGRQYSFQNLQKNGLDYNQERDKSYLIEVKKNEFTEKFSNENRGTRTVETNKSFVSSQSFEGERTNTNVARIAGFFETSLEQIGRTESDIENGKLVAQGAKYITEGAELSFNKQESIIAATNIFDPDKFSINGADTIINNSESANPGFIEPTNADFSYTYEANKNYYLDSWGSANGGQESEILFSGESGLRGFGSSLIEDSANVTTQIQISQEGFYNSQLGANQESPQNSTTEIQGNCEGIEANQIKNQSAVFENVDSFDESLTKQISTIMSDNEQNRDELDKVISGLEESDDEIMGVNLELKMKSPEIIEPEQEQEEEELEEDYDYDMDYEPELTL